MPASTCPHLGRGWVRQRGSHGRPWSALIPDLGEALCGVRLREGISGFVVSTPSYDPEMVRRRWRDYKTSAGRRPVQEFLAGLSDSDVAAVVAAMKEVQVDGLVAARHLRGEIYEVRADGDRQAFRILFAAEGQAQQVLLALEGISKKTQRTPPEVIRLAERRLSDWRRRARK